MKVTEFANAIYDLYPPYREWDETTLKAWTNAIVRGCGSYSDTIRERAFNLLTEIEHKNKPPQVATIIEQCHEAKRWFDHEQRKQGKLPVVAESQQADDYGYGTADLLIQCAMGKQAAKEGWIGALHGFAAKHRRLPTDAREVAACKKEATETNTFIAEVMKGRGKSHAQDIAARCADTMIARRQELEKKALG